MNRSEAPPGNCRNLSLHAHSGIQPGTVEFCTFCPPHSFLHWPLRTCQCTTRASTTLSKNCTCGISTFSCTVCSVGTPALRRNWNVQHSIDELNLRDLRELELVELLEHELHDHRNVSHRRHLVHDLRLDLRTPQPGAQYLFSALGVPSWCCAYPSATSTLPGAATWHQSSPSALLPRTKMTNSGTGTSTNCSTSCGSESSLRCGMESCEILGTSMTCTTPIFRNSASWSTKGVGDLLYGVPPDPLLRPDVSETVRPCTPELRHAVVVDVVVPRAELRGEGRGSGTRPCTSPRTHHPALAILSPREAVWCVNSPRTMVIDCRSCLGSAQSSPSSPLCGSRGAFDIHHVDR